MNRTLSLSIFALIVAACALSAPVLYAQPAVPEAAAPQEEPADAETTVPPEVQPSEPEASAGPAQEERLQEAPATDAVGQAKGVYTAVKNGQWMLALGFLGMLLGTVGRYLMGLRWDFWSTKTGGYAVAGLVGFALFGAGVVDNGGAFSLNILMTSIAATLAAMGLHGPAKAVGGLVKKKASTAA